MIILAIDPSTTKIGWCLAHDQHHVQSGVLNLADGAYKKADAWQRLARLRAWTEQTLVQYGADVLVAEEPTGDHLNRRTDRLLGAALGVLLAEACRADVVFDLVHPSQVKATGFSKVDLWAAAALIGVPVAEMGADRADAIGVWQAWLRVIDEQRRERGLC